MLSTRVVPENINMFYFPKYVIIDSGNILVMNKRQAITGTNDDQSVSIE